MNDDIKEIVLECFKNNLNVANIRETFGLNLSDIGELLVSENDDYVSFETNISKTILYIYNKNKQLVYTEDYNGKIIENIFGNNGRIELMIDSENGPEFSKELFK